MEGEMEKTRTQNEGSGQQPPIGREGGGEAEQAFEKSDKEKQELPPGQTKGPAHSSANRNSDDVGPGGYSPESGASDLGGGETGLGDSGGGFVGAGDQDSGEYLQEKGSPESGFAAQGRGASNEDAQRSDSGDSDIGGADGGKS